MDSEQVSVQPMEVKRRRRGAGKRAVLRVLPPPALPVRALWESASAEQQEAARVRCVAMLEYWLGRTSREQAMERLGVASLRLWQLSRLALSGMLAGLLHQPRSRGKGRATMELQREERAREKRIRELEKENHVLARMVELLRGLPTNRDVKIPPEDAALLERHAGRGGGERSGGPPAAGGARGRGSGAGRRGPAGRAAAGQDRGAVGRDGAHAVELEGPGASPGPGRATADGR